MGILGRRRLWALRVMALLAALVVSVPAGTVSARFFPLVRRSIQMSLLPQHPSSTLVYDSCARIQMNVLPPYCERVFNLPVPNPALAGELSSAIRDAGWEITAHYSGKGYDWYARKPMNMDCYVYHSNVWGINESLVLAVLGDQWYRIMGGGNPGYCNRYSKTF